MLALFSSCINDDKGNAQTTKVEPTPKAINKTETTNTAKTTETVAQDPALLGKPVSSIASGCDLLSISFVAKTFGVNAADIEVKPSGKGMEHAKACFYKWNKPGVKDAGMFVQVQQNPLPEEFPEWAAYYVQAKLDHGDKAPDGSQSHRYKAFDMGHKGAYNYDLGRYVWRTEQGNIFMVAFNLDGSEPEYLRWADILGKEATKNFY